MKLDQAQKNTTKASDMVIVWSMFNGNQTSRADFLGVPLQCDTHFSKKSNFQKVLVFRENDRFGKLTSLNQTYGCDFSACSIWVLTGFGKCQTHYCSLRYHKAEISGIVWKIFFPSISVKIGGFCQIWRVDLKTVRNFGKRSSFGKTGIWILVMWKNSSCLRMFPKIKVLQTVQNINKSQLLQIFSKHNLSLSLKTIFKVLGGLEKRKMFVFANFGHFEVRQFFKTFFLQPELPRLSKCQKTIFLQQSNIQSVSSGSGRVFCNLFDQKRCQLTDLLIPQRLKLNWKPQSRDTTALAIFISFWRLKTKNVNLESLIGGI